MLNEANMLLLTEKIDRHLGLLVETSPGSGIWIRPYFTQSAFMPITHPSTGMKALHCRPGGISLMRIAASWATNGGVEYDYQKIKERMLELIPDNKFRSDAEMVAEGWFD